MNVCNLDTDLFRAINGLAGRSAALDSAGFFFASILIYLMVGSVILSAWYRFVKVSNGRTLRMAVRDLAVMLRAAAASLLAVTVNFLFSLMFFRERPFVALEGVTRLIGEPITSKSLPSDHSSMAFAIAVSAMLVHPGFGAVLLVAAVCVALGRVFVGVHFPSDVVAGMFVGVLAAAVVNLIGRRFRDIRFIKRELKTLRKMRRRRK